MIVVPTLHPGTLLRSNEEQRGQARFQDTVVGDLKRAARLMYARPEWDESVIWERDPAGRPWRMFPTQAEVHDFFVRFYAAASEARAADGTRWEDFGLTVDVETTKDTPFECVLICVGMGYEWQGRADVLCVPFVSQFGTRYWQPGPAWSPGDESAVRGMMASVFGDETMPKVFHNKEFDKAVLREKGLRVAGPERDTMAAHHVVDSELPHGLGFVGSVLFESRYWKDDVKGGTGWLELPDLTLRSYNLRDILTTARAVPHLHRLVRQYGQWPLYQEELETTRIMGRATRRGIFIDQQRREQFRADLEKQKADALEELRAIAGGPVDPGKPLHLAYFLFTHLGFPVVKTTKTGKAATDKEALMLLGLAARTDEQRRALKALSAYRQAEKFIGTFINGLEMGPDGALHVQWKHLTTSGRLNSSPNAQNWNKKVKRMFRARPGFKLVGVDLSQAELRYIAYQTGDAELLRMYREGINVHTVNATLLFAGRCPVAKDLNPQTEAYLREMCPRLIGEAYDALPLFPKESWKSIRTLAKNFVFGSNYGAKAETLFNVLRSKRDPETNELLFPDLELSEIEALLEMWKKIHPAIPAWWDATCRATTKRGYAACPISGRRRWFREGFKRNEMLNVPIQTGVASWVNRCMNLIQRTFDAETGGEALIIQQVHDALTAEVPEGYAKRAGDVMLEVINQPFSVLGYADATLPADNYDVGTFLDEV